MKALLTIIAIVISTAVLASGNREAPSNQKQGQIQGQVQKQSLHSSNKANSYSDSSASSQSSTSSQSSNGGNRISYRDRLQAPSLGGPASGPCTGFSGGVSVPGFGFNGASVDDECNKREAYRLGSISSDPEIRAIAKKIYLSLDVVKAVTQPKKAAIQSSEFVSIYD